MVSKAASTAGEAAMSSSPAHQRVTVPPSLVVFKVK